MSIYLADQSELVLEGLCISAGPRKKHFQPNMQLQSMCGSRAKESAAWEASRGALQNQVEALGDPS